MLRLKIYTDHEQKHLMTFNVHPLMTTEELQELILNCGLLCNSKSNVLKIERRTIKLKQMKSLLGQYMLQKGTFRVQNLAIIDCCELKIVAQRQIGEKPFFCYKSAILMDEEKKGHPFLFKQKVIRQACTNNLYACYSIPKSCFQSYQMFESLLILRKAIIKNEDNYQRIVHCEQSIDEFNFMFDFIPALPIKLIKKAKTQSHYIQSVIEKIIRYIFGFQQTQKTKIFRSQAKSNIKQAYALLQSFLEGLSLNINGMVIQTNILLKYYQSSVKSQQLRSVTFSKEQESQLIMNIYQYFAFYQFPLIHQRDSCQNQVNLFCKMYNRLMNSFFFKNQIHPTNQKYQPINDFFKWPEQNQIKQLTNRMPKLYYNNINYRTTAKKKAVKSNLKEKKKNVSKQKLKGKSNKSFYDSISSIFEKISI